MKHPKHTILTHYTVDQEEIDVLAMFDDRDLASLAGKVEHKDDWEALLGTLDRWRDRT